MTADPLAGVFEDLNVAITRPYKAQQQKINPYEWSMKYRSFGGLPPEIIPAMRHVYEDMHPSVVILKAAQVFISEYFINMTLWCADTGWGYRGNALYVMPSQTHMDDFSQARFSKAIEESDYLRERVASSSGNRLRLRRIGPNTMYFRGSETTAQIRTIDADLVINDEVDIFASGAVDKSRERLGSARAPLWRAGSQPTYPEVGIDTLYRNSDMRRWFIKCSHCNHDQHLTWDENVIFNLDDQGRTTPDTEVRLVCAKCRRWIDPLSPGHWEAESPGRDVHGYHISKLYSPRANLRGMLEKFLAVDEIETLQSFYTADLGIPYRPLGSKPSIQDYQREEYPWRIPTEDSYMGIDVGNLLHCVIYGRNKRGPIEENPFRLMDQRYFDNFDDLDAFYRHMRPRYTIIDARGDPRATTQWAEKYFGRVYRWEHVASRTNPEFSEKEDQRVRFDRTSMLDQAYRIGRSRPAQTILHSHITPDFVAQLTAPVRELVRDTQNRLVPRYVSERADHYAFANAYAITAMVEFGIGRNTMQAATTPRYNSEDGEVAPLRKTSLLRPIPRWAGNKLTRR